MARFLLACYPFAGHLHPNIAVAHALEARGHEVGIYSGSEARELVESEGFSYFPYAEEMDARLRDVVLPEQGSSLAAEIPINRSPLTQIQSIKAALHEWFLKSVPAQVRDLRGVIGGWRPGVLVTDVPLFAPFLVLHETEQIPVAAFCVLLACPLPGPDAPTWGRGLSPPRNWHTCLRSKVERKVQSWILSSFRAEVDRLRRSYGLSPLSCSVMEFSGRLPLFLVAGAPELDYNRHDLPSSVHYVGPCLWHRSHQDAPPSWLSKLPGDRPVVYVTEGTVHSGESVLLNAAAQGLSNGGMEVIMTTGKNRDPAKMDFGCPLAPNIRVERYVSHGDLFPHTDVVVTTGGPGTISTALISNVPLIIVPTGWDHIENAQRIVEAGVGLKIAPRNCTPERLKKAVQTILKDPSYRRNAEQIGKALQRQGGPARAALLLERLLASTLGREWLSDCKAAEIY
jgi:MGT family glycosyltransferase